MICPESEKESHESKINSETSNEELQKLQTLIADRYRIIRKLGAGGMASVYLAHEIALDREVAIKLLPERFHHDKEFIKRFKREAKISAKLEHPHIVRIYQISEDTELSYFVMNYIKGGSLTEQIKKKGALPVDDIVRWGMDICSALKYAHGFGVIHRDLKPDNIMIDHNGRAVVMDFGIARAVEGTRLTQDGAVIGSPQYMSPEQAQGTDIEARSDIYSLGIVLYQMTTATMPFEAENIPSLMYMHVHKAPDPPDTRNLSVSPGLQKIILKCIAKNPQDRFASAEELSLVLGKQKLQEKAPDVLKEEIRKKSSTGNITDIFAKIPMFRGLSLNQLMKIIKICTMQKLSKNGVLCYAGEESYKIFILIKGKLRVTFRESAEFSSISPLEIVGEMGVFSGQRRSANVIADCESVVLTIHKTELFTVFNRDPELGLKVQKNVIEDLSDKIRENHIIIKELKKVCTPGKYSRIISEAAKASER